MCCYGFVICVMPDFVFVVSILIKPVAGQGLLCRHVYCYLFRTCSCMEVTVRLVFKTEILAGETMYKSNIDRLNFLWGL